MRLFKRVVSAVLLLCLLVTLLPAMSFVRAAEVVQRYVLDTDGIDVGATYLIVNTNATGTGNALLFYYGSSSSRDLRNQTVTIENDGTTTYISAGFTNEATCQFQFSGTKTGRITHGSYSVNLNESKYVTGNPSNTLTFNDLGSGRFQIYYTSLWRNYYLQYNNSDWTRSSSFSTSNTSNAPSVYLFKLTETVVGYDITFNGNGYTHGTLPDNVIGLSYGDPYTLPTNVELRKDIGEDTWLFLGWNSLPDGSGTEYAQGETITVTSDITLYADWYLQTKYTVSMITYLDGQPTDVDKISGTDKQFFAKLEGDNSAPYLPLTKSAEGTYTTKVADNGTYVIYSKTDGSDYEEVHGHKVVIFNQDGSTECMHYSVVYDTAGGTWNDGEAPGTQYHHFQEPVHVIGQTPTLAGNRFLGWEDADGKRYTPGQHLTSSIDRPIELTALWEKALTVTVNVTINHNAGGGADNSQGMHDFLFTLLREENNVNLPILEQVVNSGYTYDSVNNITTYTLVFNDLPQGTYHVSGVKTHYELTVEHSAGTETNHVINLNLQYAPNTFDLHFDVNVNAENETELALKPKAVNVKISYWGYNEQGELGWHIITQQADHAAPTTVWIDENGNGTAFFPVWCYWSGTEYTYEYRVEVTSIVMPDDTIVPMGASGMYTATVNVNGGRIPSHPEGSSTTLNGAYYDGATQSGRPVVTIEITPLSLRFEAGEGTINDQSNLTLENIIRYPDLEMYKAVPHDTDRVFIGWTDAEGNLVTDMEGQLLEGNVTLYALYSKNITLTGTVTVDDSYLLNGDEVYVNAIDLPESVLVVLQKKVGDIYNDIDSCIVNLTYDKNSDGVGTYSFIDLPNDGSEYRIHVLVRNYHDAYDNDYNQIFSEEEALLLVNPLTSTAQVDAYLDFVPDSYEQSIKVDTSRIHADLRPTGATVQILYRDLGDIHNYNVITQHAAGGIRVDFPSSVAYTSESVWSWHTDGAPYEYQVQISTLYGNNVTGAYTEAGLPYTADSPFTIVYGSPNNYLRQSTQGAATLTATLVPKEYSIILDVQADDGVPVYGLEEYLVDDGSGHEHYAFIHTWSYTEHFTAYPYKEGHVFTGWTSSDKNDVYVEDGKIHVGNTLAHDVTLTANWEPLEGTDYTIRYLELNTDKVLKGATVVQNATLNSTVSAATVAPAIEGYVYAGAMVGGTYIDKYDNPEMTITNNPAENLLVIYYLPDGSDGYTEQVESNLELNKTATLENDGTYTITLDTYTKDNPITTLIQQNTPLDIVLVLDQSGSLVDNNYLQPLEDAVENFVTLVAQHGKQNAVDHRIAIVGYASNDVDGDSDGNKNKPWLNTGVFDSNGVFHKYNVNGFNYTELTDTSSMNASGTYYTKIVENGKDKYLLLTYHSTYYHLLTEEEARVATLQGQDVYGYVYDNSGKGSFQLLTRNSSGLWLYGDKKLYSNEEFFTYHTDVWTHRNGMERREIHAYGLGASYTPTDGHEGVFTRTETTDDSYYQSIYEDALVPVSIGASGSGGINPGLTKAIGSLGSDGATRASYGMEMANSILAAHPLGEEEKDRLRLIVMFTDGEPGYNGFSSDEYYAQAVAEANAAIQHAYIAKHDHNAYVYSIGLYKSNGVDEDSEVAYYMNALSSNYPNAQRMADIKNLTLASSRLVNNGNFYVLVNGVYYEIMYGNVSVSGSNRSQNRWYYQINGVNYNISTNSNVTPSNGTISNFSYKVYMGTGYATTKNSGYYTTTDSSDHLKDYFEDVLRDITTKITTEVVLENDTILRDIMNQGLVLTDGTVITVYTQEGNYDLATGNIKWTVDSLGNPILEKKVSLTLGGTQTSIQDPVSGVAIYAYNLDAANPTNPDDTNYHPHTVDITGYNFSEWYISASHTKGYKMVVTITRVEARDDVQWGRSTTTNNNQSGLWLPADKDGNRQLLLPFDQPTTIFVERTYVLDYGKEFILADWYFDDEDGKNATPIHVDCDITNGMNWFDPQNPNISNAIGGAYGNTKYGNVRVEDGNVIYAPTSTNWGGFDQFYVFGNTWRKTVLAQDANENGNLWNKVTVLPANNIYYEDSFVTTEDTTQNGIEGFTFTGAWSIVGTDSGNTEVPEHLESLPHGSVHGWTDSLSNDTSYSDGSAHGTGLNGEMGAQAQFTFTGTGIEVYTRTNSNSGIVVAVLNRKVTGADGTETTIFHKSLAMDNLAASGDYYQIPTIAFKDLPYGTYSLQLIATGASTSTGGKRFEYYIDGIRVHNPLGNNLNTFQSETIKDAYDLETFAVFTEVRDILLDYDDFNADLSNSSDGKMGAVFIDWIQEEQGDTSDPVGTGVPTYTVGTFKTYGPKNEVYLSAGQAIVLRVAEGNQYFVGLKSLTGKPVTVNVSGRDMDEPTTINLTHTTDLYYQVTPIAGYIVIQNGNTDDAILSISNLRTTNLNGPAENGGVLDLEGTDAVELLTEYTVYMQEKRREEQLAPPSEPEEELPDPQDQAQSNIALANSLFASVRHWLELEEEVETV